MVRLEEGHFWSYNVPRIIFSCGDYGSTAEVDLSTAIRTEANNAVHLRIEVNGETESSEDVRMMLDINGKEIMEFLQMIIEKLPMSLITEPSEGLALLARMVLANLEE
jgi:hypothetical protein